MIPLTMVFIVIEGIDAAGKHTHTELLRHHFLQQSRKVTKFSAPDYNTVTGEMILDFLNDRWTFGVEHSERSFSGYHTAAKEYAFQCCQTVNRLESLPEELWTHHKADDHVFIADRYNTSALAYGKAAGLHYDWLLKIHKPFPKPDITIFLDIPVSMSFSRRPQRRDKYERDEARLNRVRDCYRQIFTESDDDSLVILDATSSVEVVHNKILEVLKSHGLLDLKDAYIEI